MRSILRIAIGLALMVGASSAPCQTASLPDADDRRIVAAYVMQSNAVRNKITDAYKLAADVSRETQIKEFSQAAKALDATVTPTAVKLLKSGYWRSAEGRDVKFDETIRLIVQHSGDLDVQVETLRQLEPLVALGAFDGQNFGLLFDRVAIAQGRLQRFATQLRCEGGKFVLEPVENPESVDKIRAEYGFVESSSDYLSGFKELKC